MNNILVPTDFSPNAYKAMEYAVEVANAAGATIQLVHTYKVSNKAGMLISIEAHIEEDVRKEMDQMLDHFGPKMKQGAYIKTQILRGETIQTLAKLAEQWPADLIIMGTQGASGLKEIFFGSVTSGVISQTKVPLLAIPRGFEFDGIHTIVFAIDDQDLGSQDVIAPLTALAKTFDAKIMVFHQEGEEGDQGIDPALESYLEHIDHSFHFELDREDVTESIRDFVEDYGANVLCMIQRKRGFIQSLFHSSVTKREVFHSEVPVLILKELE